MSQSHATVAFAPHQTGGYDQAHQTPGHAHHSGHAEPHHSHSSHQSHTAEGDYVECDEHGKEAHRRAHDLFSKKPDWVSFYRDVLGLQGIVRQTHPTHEARCRFERTREWEDIQHMVAKLREYSNKQPNPNSDEPTRVITVRLPKSLHEALRAEAHEKHTSMNKLCISKLLQFIDNDLVPNET